MSDQYNSVFLGEGFINLTDITNPINQLNINGRSVYIEDTSNNVVTSTIPWSQLIDRVSNCDAVVQNPNDATLKLNHILLLDNGVNTRTITPTSNPATTIDVGEVNANSTYHLLFTDTSGNSKDLLTDMTPPTALTYNPNTSTITASTFSGTATGIQLTGNSATAERSVPFSNTTVGGARTLLVDTQSNAFQYNAGLQRLSVNNIRTYGTISSESNITIDPSNVLIVQGNLDLFGQLDMENNNIVNCPIIRNNDGDIQVKSETTTGTLELNSTTINFVDTSTTTSTANHNAEIKTTSNGVSTTSFLKVKLNGNDIWIPYFTTNPSL